MPTESHERVAIECLERALLGLREAHVRARSERTGEEARPLFYLSFRQQPHAARGAATKRAQNSGSDLIA